MTREYHLTGATNLGRRISRRLSMSVAKVPVFIQSRFRTDDIVNIDTNQGAGSTGGQQGNGASAAGLMMRWPQQLRRSRPVTLHIILPNGIERTITSTGKCTVKQAVSPVALELHICEFRLRMSDTLAIVSPSAEASLLDGDSVLLEDATRVRDERGETDSRFRLTEDLLDTEREFMISLRTIYDVYARPLRKLCSISDEEQKQLFGGIEPVLSVSNMLLTKLEDALSSWDPHETRIGSLFSKQFWNQFEEYYRFFSQAKELLREKHCRDEEFAEICKLRQGAALHTIDSLLDLPIQRLASYERYFQDLLCETAADHPDLDEVHKARDKAQELVKRCEEEINQLDRVQNLFPNDHLYLHDKDALSLKMKGLIRKRSTTAARLQRAFSAKSLGRTPPTTPTSTPSTSSTMDTIDGPSCNNSPAPSAKRQFIMEASVQFVNGLQVQERHLFLFNDLLLIAKARSGGHFKLKDKVRISELWLDALAVDEVAEGSAVTKSRDTSFVIGWPPSVNLVAIFSSAALRDLWWNRLGQAVKEERDREPKATTIQITYHDAVQAIEYFKTLSVTPTETVRDVIKLALSHLEMSGTADVNSFRLWLKTGSAASSPSGVGVSSSVEGDSSSSSTPYPLIGHELPFAIKMNCLRDYICRSASENDNEGSGLDMLDHCNNIYNADPATRCQFILRSVQKPAYTAKLSEGAKGASKTKKSPTRIQKVFRRVQSKPDSLETVGATTPAGAYFAQPLNKIFLAAGDQIPAPILEMLLELRAKGPHTVGIFRKSANARQVREIRERIDSGLRMDWSTVSAVVTAVVFKDFLRSLPDSLLGSASYDQWLQVAAVDGQEVSIDKIKGLCDRLPSANVTLLRHFMCVLLHITSNSTQNMMSASNLAVCVGPSLLWAPLPATSATATPSAGLNPALALSAEATASKQVPALVAVLIEKCALLFGAETVNLLSEKGSVPSTAATTTTPAAVPLEIRRTSAISNGSVPSSSRNKAPVQKHMARHGLMQHDSGNEESDSLHSLYHSDIRRDDSSIDSLERELLGDHHHHNHHHHVHSSAIHMRRDKMSVTNLSRDSGLTLSDTQLYTPDEDMEEGSESSSSGRGSDRDKSRNGMAVMRPRTATTTGVSTTTATQNSSSRIDQARSMYAVPSSTQRIADNGIYGKLNSIPSSYTPVYSDQRVLRKLSDDVVYAVPKATPTVVLAEEFVQSQSSSSFQRQDWFRRKSHNRTKSQSGGVKFDDECDHDSPRLRRSASDESLANVTSSDMLYHHHHHNAYHHHQNGMNNSKKPASHRKGRAPAPPRSNVMDCMELSRRSNSVAQLDGGDAGMRFINQDEPDRRSHHQNKNGSSSVRSSGQASLRPSLSTPHINNGGDRSYDSSTLSDDDSTPHVSRSNSRGSKDYRAVNSAWESAYGALTVPVPAPIHIIVSQDGTGSIVYNKSGGGGSSRSSHSNRMSNHGDHRSRQVQHQQRQNVTHSAPSAAAPSSRSYCATPPTGRYGDYDTVIYAGRRSQQKQEPSGRNTSTTPDIPSYEEAMLIRRCQRQPANGNGTNWTTWKDRSPSSNLIQVHASPIRLKGQQQQPEAPPIPPKTDPIPPLPPKQRIHLRPSKTAEHVSSNRPRPVTIHMDASILSELDTPPSLPKKERRGNNVSVVSIENSYTPLHRSFAFSTHNLRTAMENGKGGEDWTKEDHHHLDEEEEKNKRDRDMQTSGHWAQFCEIETQTSLSPQPSLTTTNNTSSSDEATSAPAKKTVGRYEKNTGRTKSRQVVETDRSRPRMRDSSTGRDAMVVHRSHSLPPMDKTSSDESEADEPLEKSKNVINRKQQEGNATSQALRRAEISWSVSQLRAIFNGNATNSTGTTPPPYRSPPAHLQPSSQQRQRSESTDSYGEESYV